MPGATLLDTGVTTWTDNQDNWRSADADYLQKRSVMRFLSVGSRTTYLGSTPGSGMLTYVNDTLQYSDSTSAASNVWRTVLALKYMATSDTASAIGMRLSSDVTDSLSLQTGKVVLGPTAALTVDTTVKVKTGAVTASLTTDATSLVSDQDIKAPSVTVTGAVTAASATIGGTLSAATVTVSSNLTAAAATVTGTLAVAQTTTLADIQMSGTIRTSALIYLRADTVGSAQTWYNGATRIGYLQGQAGAIVLAAEVGGVVIQGPNVILSPASGAVRYGTATGPQLACSVSSATDPGITNYPEGTLWCQI